MCLFLLFLPASSFNSPASAVNKQTPKQTAEGSHFHPRLRCKFAAVHNCKMRMGNTVGCIVANGSNFSNPVRRDASLFGACNGGVDLVRVRQLVSPSHRLSLVQVPAPNSRIQRDPAGARGDRTACGELVQGEMSRGQTLSKCDSGDGDRSKSRVSTMSSWRKPGRRPSCNFTSARQLICASSTWAKIPSRLLAKNISVYRKVESSVWSLPSRPARGASRERHDTRGGMRWTRVC
jgi:hypothetical protein